MYANTSAAIKARADWVVTSSIAVDVIDHLDAKGEKILWAPDKYLGNYVRKKTGADMVLWDGSCIVHEEFKAQGILDMLKVFTEFETRLRHERQMEGIKKAKEKGVYKGRKQTVDVVKIKELASEGLMKTEIAKRLGIGRATVYRALGD